MSADREPRAPLRRRPLAVGVAATAVALLASWSWFPPLVLVAAAAVPAAGVYVRRWWYPLAQAAPLALLVPILFLAIRYESGSEPGLAAMMAGALQAAFVVLASFGCLAGWLVCWIRARGA